MSVPSRHHDVSDQQPHAPDAPTTLDALHALFHETNHGAHMVLEVAPELGFTGVL